MPRTRILSVGQCGYDHGGLSRRLGHSLDAEVVPAATHAEALASLRDRGPFDLVLVRNNAIYSLSHAGLATHDLDTLKLTSSLRWPTLRKVMPTTI